MTSPAYPPFPEKKRIDPVVTRAGHTRIRAVGTYPAGRPIEPATLANGACPRSATDIASCSFEAPVFFCCGEPSGDLYAGHVIRRLRSQCPRVEILAVGGTHMAAAGARIVMGFEGLRAFGMSDGLSTLRSNCRTYQDIARTLVRRRIRTFVAVAYPGMNLLLCRVARRHKMRVLYLLPPQIWAWGGWRRSLLKRWVDLVISVFPFEADHIKVSGLNTVLIDNPLVSSLRAYRRIDQRRRVGFMPGSRPRMIARHLGVITYLAGLIRAWQPAVELCLIAAGEAEARSLAGAQDVLPVRYQDRYQLMKNCDLLITSSGTASLEAAAMAIPQIFFHRPSFLDDQVLRRFVMIREFNLANLYYGRPIVECYIDRNAGKLRRQLARAVRERMGTTERG